MNTKDPKDYVVEYDKIATMTYAVSTVGKSAFV